MKIETIYTFDLYAAEHSDIYLECTSKCLPVVGEKFTYSYKSRSYTTDGIVISFDKHTLSNDSKIIRFTTKKNNQINTDTNFII